MKFHSVRGRLKLKGYRGRHGCYLGKKKSTIFQFQFCQFIQNRSTDIHDGAGPSLHSTLLMAPEQQLLKFFKAHIHILHGIRDLYPAQTHNTHIRRATQTHTVVSPWYLCAGLCLDPPMISFKGPTCPGQVFYSSSPALRPQSPSLPEQTEPLQQVGQEVLRSTPHRRRRRMLMLWPLLPPRCLLSLPLLLLGSQAPL